MIFSSFYILLSIVLLMVLIFFGIEFYNIVFKGFAPIISTRKDLIYKIVERLDIKDNSRVYELGCGKASFLKAVRAKNQKAELFGIEISPLLYLIAQIQNSLSESKIKIFKENFFKTDLSGADIIYCYLNLETMKRLEAKVNKECKNGTIIISYQFPFPNIVEKDVMSFNNDRDRIYFYTIEK